MTLLRGLPRSMVLRHLTSSQNDLSAGRRLEKNSLTLSLPSRSLSKRFTQRKSCVCEGNMQSYSRALPMSLGQRRAFQSTSKASKISIVLKSSLRANLSLSYSHSHSRLVKMRRHSTRYNISSSIVVGCLINDILYSYYTISSER